MIKRAGSCKGVLEKREILTATLVTQIKYFLLTIDTTTRKVVSTHGAFNTPEDAVAFAKIHSISIE